ncbi:SRPBCC family protein [Nocardia sp. NPDC004654]|uniref:type II toxin-antitoxin system RatA family toxin n=1 Tax=Nocardia sp. NPDC004654 TaxID=3154776 RepID=UPI0033BAE622
MTLKRFAATVEINAPIDCVWNVIADVESVPEWQARLTSVKALERDSCGRATLCDMEAHAVGKTFKGHAVFSYEQPTRVSWRQTKGGMKVLTGQFELAALADGRTAATFALDAILDGILKIVVRGPIERAVIAMFIRPRVRDLQARVEQLDAQERSA